MTITPTELRQGLTDGTAPPFIRQFGKRKKLIRIMTNLWGYIDDGEPQGNEVVVSDGYTQDRRRGRPKVRR